MIIQYNEYPVIVLKICPYDNRFIKGLMGEEISYFYQICIASIDPQARWCNVVNWGNYSGTLFLLLEDKRGQLRRLNQAISHESMGWYWDEIGEGK